MKSISYYFLEKTYKDGYLCYIGKRGKHIYYNECDWWDIKEYGFLDNKNAKILVDKYNKKENCDMYNVKEIKINFKSELDRLYFIDRFIKPYYNNKIIKTILGE